MDWRRPMRNPDWPMTASCSGGLCIRPDSPEWYCAICEESFGAWRESWGEPLTNRIQ